MAGVGDTGATGWMGIVMSVTWYNLRVFGLREKRLEVPCPYFTDRPKQPTPEGNVRGAGRRSSGLLLLLCAREHSTRPPQALLVLAAHGRRHELDTAHGDDRHDRCPERARGL